MNVHADAATQEVTQVTKLGPIAVAGPEEEVQAEARDDVDANDARSDDIEPSSECHVGDIAIAPDDIEAGRGVSLSPDPTEEMAAMHRLSSEIIAARSHEEAIPEENESMEEEADDRDDVQEKEGVSANATSASGKLQEMMLERIESIDVIRSLINRELEQDSALIAEFTDKVSWLEML